MLSGDSPHYLVVVNSLIEDGDFDISNNYRQGEAGDLDFGRRLRGTPIDHHVDRTSDGKELSVHAPFLPMALAPVAWPFRGSEWVEPVCIFVSLAVAFAGVVRFARGAGWSFAIMLALATPLWSYARDLWTEPWAAAAWVGLMFSRHPGVLAVLAFSGTVLKYPFALVPMIMGAFAFQERDYRRAAVLLGAPVLALLFSIVFIQYLYQDVPHFSLFHLGSHAGFNWPFDGIYGLLLDPVDGLLWFSPFLAWGFGSFRKGGAIYLPAIAFFLVHAGYEFWSGGTGFSARYLVPMLPVLVWGVKEAEPKGWVFRLALAWSALWAFIGGVFPYLAYDRPVWDLLLLIPRSLANG